MSFDYDAAAFAARQRIEKYGGVVTFARVGNKGGFDDAGNASPNEPDYNIFPLCSPLLACKESEIDGKSIIQGDAKCLSLPDEAIEIGMVAKINGKDWRVVAVRDVSSLKGDLIYSKVYLRA